MDLLQKRNAPAAAGARAAALRELARHLGLTAAHEVDELAARHVEAVADAASSRLEPIALTSFATIIGLIPITLSDPLWRGLGGAIIAGLAFSGTIMLFFIPVVYYYWFRNDHSLDKK